MAIEKWGNPKTVTGPNGADESTVAALPNGGYIVVWDSRGVTCVQVYDGLGNPVGARQDLASTVGTPRAPKVTVLDDGSFIVGWSGANATVQAQKFSVTGAKDGGLFTIASPTTTGLPRNDFPSFASDGNEWVAVWAASNDTQDVIHFKRQDGTQFNIVTGSGVTQPDVTELADGRHAVTWEESGVIKVALVGANNTVTVLTGNASGQNANEPKITALSNGGFVVSWQEGNARKFSTQVYDANGGKVATGSLQQNGTWTEYPPEIVALTKGGFAGGYAVIYEDWVGNDNGDIYLQLVKADGTIVGPKLINDGALQKGDQGGITSVTELPDGRISIVWDDGTDGNGVIRNQIIDAREIAVTVNGTSHNDIYVGTDIVGQVDTLNGKAGNDSLYGGAGDDFLNGGAGADRLDGGAGFNWADYVDAVAGVTANLKGSVGNTGEALGDTYVNIQGMRGSSHNDVLTGRDGGTQLSGMGGNDTLNGGTGNDHLQGADGDDWLYGGAGRDILSGGFDNLSPSDTKARANVGDTASYQGAAAGVTASLRPGDANDNAGDAAGDTYDSIENLVGSEHSDALTGTETYNWMAGNDGNDLIKGLGGDDLIWGQGGNDTLVGGAGNDTLNGGDRFDYASYQDVTVGGVEASLDDSTQNEGDAEGDSYDSIEGLIGSAQADGLTGDANNNVLIGGAGADTLRGAEGSDTLVGGAGGDTLRGYDGFDYASYANADAGVTADLSNPVIFDLAPVGFASVAGTGEAAGDTYEDIEGLIGSNAGDTLYGSSIDNHILGGDGNDILTGRAGNDTLDGGSGLNTAVFSGSRAQSSVTRNADGTVTVTGPDGIDLLKDVRQLQFADGTEFVNAAPTGLTLSNASIRENAPGNAEVGTLAATDLDGDRITYSLAPGSSGSFGIIGNSLVVTGPLDFETRPLNQVTILASDPYGGVASLTVNITVTNYTGETTPFTLRGTSRADTLRGEAGNDTIYGSNGNDTLYGEFGNDRIFGGTGNDKLYGSSGKDVFVFDTRLNKSTNVDRIYDFRSSDDSFYLDNKYFTKLGSGSLSKPKKFKSDMFIEGKKAQDREDRIVYDKKTGALYYDQDGTGSKAQVKIATISNKVKLYYHDFYVI
ncbi:cadherin domain-containing protein [Microvirga sp. VF16]|uniref:cadherin domain-containing protein n=1 Tax=Microvirga sp. VF16 TaxID=2807101 RepID=UPI00193CCB6F|nr:cadherin domain-containing protein [Microvirga sp. VF16]QRM29387.1 cadherin domain-containing protein [Microvirga sp. VF16]